jgi:hypothetical protein
MLLKEIIEQPILKVLEKDDIWRIIDELSLDNCDSSSNFDLEKNTQIKLNVIMDEWDDRDGFSNDHIEVYTITFEDKVIGIGGSLGDCEDTFKHEIHFIDKQGYVDMIAYLYRLRIKKEWDIHIESLDFDFKL